VFYIIKICAFFTDIDPVGCFCVVFAVLLLRALGVLAADVVLDGGTEPKPTHIVGLSD
jgi:hypothetical protein